VQGSLGKVCRGYEYRFIVGDDGLRMKNVTGTFRFKRSRVVKKALGPQLHQRQEDTLKPTSQDPARFWLIVDQAGFFQRNRRPFAKTKLRLRSSCLAI
jgi:hypothetical protein